MIYNDTETSVQVMIHNTTKLDSSTLCSKPVTTTLLPWHNPLSFKENKCIRLQKGEISVFVVCLCFSAPRESYFIGFQWNRTSHSSLTLNYNQLNLQDLYLQSDRSLHSKEYAHHWHIILASRQPKKIKIQCYLDILRNKMIIINQKLCSVM